MTTCLLKYGQWPVGEPRLNYHYWPKIINQPPGLQSDPCCNKTGFVIYRQDSVLNSLIHRVRLPNQVLFGPGQGQFWHAILCSALTSKRPILSQYGNWWKEWNVVWVTSFAGQRPPVGQGRCKHRREFCLTSLSNPLFVRWLECSRRFYAKWVVLKIIMHGKICRLRQ